MQVALRDRWLIGIGLACLLLNVTLLPIVFTGAVEGAVDEKFETFPLDSACGEDGNCETLEDDWAVSTTSRDYYAWDITNLQEVIENQATPDYERMGPYTYDITSEKTLIEHDSYNGHLTYNVVKTFECSPNSKNSCDEELSQLNIQFRPQLIGATGTAFNGIMDLTKIGFASGMMNQDLNTTQAGKATADYITTMTNTIGGAGFGSYGYAALGAAETAGQASVVIPNTMDGNILPIANFLGGIEQALYSSVHPLDNQFNISLLDDSGPVAFMGLGEPEQLLSTIENDPNNSTTVMRATAYGYLATEMADTTGDGNEDTMVPDYAQTLIRDWSLYIAIGLEFQSNGGGSPFTDSEDIANRLNNLLDEDFSDVDCLDLMMNGDGGDNPLGLLAQNSAGTGFGLSAFLGMDSSVAKSTFGLSDSQYDSIYSWSAAWATSSSSIQMALLGGSGTMNAGHFVNTTFGNGDPISGGFLGYSLNQGGDWGTDNSLPDIALTPEQSAEILYGELGITTTEGAMRFLYGELSGTIPPGFSDIQQTGEWGIDVIASTYGIEQESAMALKDLVVDTIFGEFVENFLVDSFGAEAYLTQSVNSWLLGWHDPVSAYLASGNPNNMSVGWASLESSETFFGSDGIKNGDGINYTICTGERSGCEKGELIEQDGSSQLSWRNNAMYTATYGLITPEDISGTTGGFITGSNDKVDVSGYAIADINCVGEGTVKEIPVDYCEASVDPTQRSIQANLLKTFSILDATPSALPIYLGSEIEISSEKTSGLIIAGKSTTKFYLDSRDGTDMKTEPKMSDLVPVFEIKSSSIIADEDAETMQSSIVQNQNYFTYWMNFDTSLDLIPFLMWSITLIFIVASFVMMKGDQFEDDEYDIEEIEVEKDEPVGLLQRLGN
ncbi:CD36 family protein [Candidatus Poseidoniaceae archaeon]|nr:CD36 family protein [Candidatus Poseidoniaceae archaeon]